jgi:hypothetical protein
MCPGNGHNLKNCATVLVLALVRIHLGVRALEIGGPEDAGRAVAGTGDEEHVEIVGDDQAVQMHPDQRERRARAPVTEQPVLDLVDGQRLLEQRVVPEVDHADRKIVAGAPVGVEERDLVWRQRLRCVNGRRHVFRR